MRTFRTNNNGGTYRYVYNGGELDYLRVTEKDSKGNIIGWVLRFSHTPDGTPLAVSYAGNYYYYITNLQGDVIAICDKNGDTVVQYSYDAWGNLLSTTGSMANTLGKRNPLRYRGYVYDRETGLYYLQSRYYNPETGRLINADAYIATGQGILGNNMFAYCGNNPVINIDPYGNCFYNSKGEWCHDNWEFIGDYERKPDPKNPYLAARNVTDEVKRALFDAADKANNKTRFWGVPQYSKFYSLVNHYAPWDIKRENPWKMTIGTRYPGKNAVVVFNNVPMGIDKVGNITYGFLGYAYGIDLDLLLVGSYAAAGFPKSGADHIEELSDWAYIEYGYNCAKNRYG